MGQFLKTIFIAAVLTAPTALAQESDVADIPDDVRATVEDLIEAGLSDELGLQFVEDITTEVGPRLAGSEAEAEARDWSVKALEAMDFDEIRIERFSIPFWRRVTERAAVVEPYPQNLVITALGGSTSTPEGGLAAELIRFESMAELRAADPDDVDGKIVFIDEEMRRTQIGSGYGVAVRKRRNCAKETSAKGGVACLIRSVGTQHRRFPHTGMMARGEAVGAGPAAALSPPDADQLARLLERGEVTVALDIQVETKRRAPSGNVIAELTGRERPDEIVLIGCHLDSWDLGTGALDDAAGCGIVLGAAQLIAGLEERPRRTIRVVLYGAEEVGLLGADAYARRHGDELDNHILASESDFGAGEIWRFQTRFGEGALPYARAIQQVLRPLGVVPDDNSASGGPDIGVLRRAGVPVVTPGQDGTDYFDYHHTPDDTFDKIEFEAFRQNVAVYAAFTYLAAEMDWNFRASVETSEEGSE